MRQQRLCHELARQLRTPRQLDPYILARQNRGDVCKYGQEL